MSTTAIFTMTAICSLVWGGFLGLLYRALRHEGRKQERGGD
jgi:hypothetical protein